MVQCVSILRLSTVKEEECLFLLGLLKRTGYESRAVGTYPATIRESLLDDGANTEENRAKEQKSKTGS